MREQHRANAKSILRACVSSILVRKRSGRVDLVACRCDVAHAGESRARMLHARPRAAFWCPPVRVYVRSFSVRLRVIVYKCVTCLSTDSNPSGAAYRVTATGTAHARSGPWPHTVTPDRPPARDRGERRVGRVGAHTCHLRPPAPLRGPHMCIPTHFRAVFRAHRGHRYLTA